MRLLLIVFLWFHQSGSFTYDTVFDISLELGQENQLSSSKDLNQNIFHLIDKPFNIKGIIHHKPINDLDETPVEMIAQSLKNDGFKDFNSFEVWDEVSDDAIEFPEENQSPVDIALIVHDTSYTLSPIKGLPDIPPEHIQ